MMEEEEEEEEKKNFHPTVHLSSGNERRGCVEVKCSMAWYWCIIARSVWVCQPGGPVCGVIVVCGVSEVL